LIHAILINYFVLKNTSEKSLIKFFIVSPSKDSLVKLRYDMQKNYLENYRIMNNTPFKRTDSPSVVKDLSGDLVQRKLLLDSINKTHANHHSEK